MGNAISADGVNCKGLYLFNNDFSDQMTSQATLSALNSPLKITFSTASPPEGDYYVIIDNSAANSAYLSVKDVSLHGSFPCKTGLADTSFTICGWFYLDKAAITAQMALVSKWDTTGNGRGFFFSITTNMATQFVTGTNAGAGAQVLAITSVAVTSGKWYHVCGWYEAITFSAKISLFELGVGVIACARRTQSSACVGVSSAFTVGCVNPSQVSAAKAYLNGRLDEWAFFTGKIDETSIASIRVGTFNAISTASGASNLFSADATCLVALRFENNINDDSQYGHTFSGVKTPLFSAHATVGTPEGTYCFAKEYGVASGYFTIDCSSLGTKYPWFTGSVISAMTMCCYARVDTAANGGFRVWAEAGNPSALYSWRLEYYTNVGVGNFNLITTGPTQTASVRYSGSGSGTHVGKWNHIFLQINNATSKYILRTYELTSGTTVSRTSGSLTNGMARGGGMLNIGRRAVTAENDISMAGAIDEFVLFNRAITTAEVDQIRAGTFLYTAAPPVGGGANLIFGLSLALGRKLQT